MISVTWGARVHAFAACVVALAVVAGTGRAELGRLTVDEAVKIALRDNSTVYNAARQVEQAEGAWKVSRSGALPQLSATGDLGHGYSDSQRSAVTGGGQVQATRTNSRSGSLNLNQQLFDLQLWSGVRQASHTLEASRASEADTRLAVALAVKQQFYAVVRAKRLAAVDGETARLDSSTQALTEGLFEVGTVAKTDVLKARTTRAQSQLALIVQRHAIDLERLRLASLLGLADDRGLDVDETLAEDVALPDSTALYDMALKYRPDLRQLDEQIRAADAGLSGARASRYPTVGFSANVTKSISTASQDTGSIVEKQLDHLGINFADTTFYPVYKDTLVSTGGTFESRPFSWSVGARVSLPLFDGFAASGRVQESAALLDIARRDLGQKRTDVALEIRQAWLALQEAKERIRVAREALAFAQESYDLTSEKYRLGSATLLDLTTAEVQLSTSKSDIVDAGVGLQLAKASLDKALGQNP